MPSPATQAAAPYRYSFYFLSSSVYTVSTMRRVPNVALSCVLLLVGAAFAYGQDLDQLASLSAKPSVSIEDLAPLLASLSQSVVDEDGYLSRLELALAAFEPETALTKGRASRVACAALNLRSSALYLLFPGERYAFRALVMEGVFKSGSSPGEAMGGMELLDFINSLSIIVERSL
jgi:hypothetical protein